MKNFMKKLTSKKKGFTIVEMLVVLAIIAIVGGGLFAAFSDKPEQARAKTNLSNLKTIETAADNYDFDKTLGDDDYTKVDANNNIVKLGYAKSVPTNPWASTSKAQKDYSYYLVKYRPSAGANTINKAYLGSFNDTTKVLTYVDQETGKVSTTTITCAVSGSETDLDGTAGKQYFTK